ncbi:MAG: hypothetical protein AAF628_01325 [Planctomycetota bacterium]
MGAAEYDALPPRTHQTDLTDDELLLADFVFCHRVCAKDLHRGIYAAHNNCGNTHGLSDEALAPVLDALVERGLFDREDSHRPDWVSYGLTPKGGALWERERQPDWSRFVMARYECGDDATNGSYCIQSPSPNAAIECLQWCRERGPLPEAEYPARSRQCDTVPHIQYRRFPGARAIEVARCPFELWKRCMPGATWHWWSSMPEWARLVRTGRAWPRRR